MNSKSALFIGIGLVSVSALMMHPVESARGAAAQTGKPIKMHRLYTGPDGQTHAQEIEVKFGPGGTDPFKLAAGAGAEIRRAPPGRVADWHVAPRRQYVITLSGHGEVELVDGTKIELGPGSIDLAEDLTGKGHITRTVGTEDRVAILIPVSDKK
jgi:quercetin dioxygenase-like cupin family protein